MVISISHCPATGVSSCFFATFIAIYCFKMTIWPNGVRFNF